MPISFVAASTEATGTNPTVTVPAGIQTGDLLLIFTVGVSTPTVPSGWTLAHRNQWNHWNTVLYKFATASESSVALTMTGTNNKAVMVAYRGAAGIDFAGRFFNLQTGTSPNTNTANSSYLVNSTVISYYGSNNNTSGQTTWTAPGSTTARFNSGNSTALTGLLIVDEVRAFAGAITSRTATLSSSRQVMSGVIILAEAVPRYWVGGSGTWDNTNTSNWSTTSGGSGGASVPNNGTDVIIDSNSGSPTITFSSTPTCRFLTVTPSTTCTFTGTGTLTVSGSMYLSPTTTWSASGLLTFDGNSYINASGVTISSPIAFNAASKSITLHNNLATTGTVTLSNGRFDGANFGLGTNTLTCFALSSNNTNTREITSSSTLNITGNNTSVIEINSTNFTGGGGVNGTRINLTYDGSVGTRTIRTGNSYDGFDLFVLGGSDTVTFSTVLFVNRLNFTGFSGTLNIGASMVVRDDFTCVSAMTVIHNNNTITFQSTSFQKDRLLWTTAGKTFYAINVNLLGQGYSVDGLTLNGDLILDWEFSCPGSDFNANGFNVTCRWFIGRPFSNLATPGFKMGSGTWTITGTDADAQSTNVFGRAFRNDTDVSIQAQWKSDTATIIFTNSQAGLKTLSLQGSAAITYYSVIIAGGSSTSGFRIENNPGLHTITTLSSTRTAAYTITLTASTTTTVGTWAVGGSSGNQITVASSTASNATLASAGNAVQKGVDWLTFNSITATPTPTNTGTVPYYWYIGNNSNKNSSTTGVVLSSDSSYKYYILTTGTSWTVPTDWNSSVNNIYLIGGGGGGGGNSPGSSIYSSGGGGGGGGFRVLSNVALTPSSSVSYTIGAGGNGGTGSSIASATAGTSGGNTTFINTSASNTAGGGTAGNANNGAGTGGSGTRTGGNASFGTSSFANTQWAGGSGGGSGGIDANGANGVGTTGGQGNGGVSNTLFVLDYGDGGAGGAVGANNGNPGLNFGGGGGGAGIGTTATTRTGGAGTAGAIVIRYQLESAASEGGKFISFFF